MKYTKKEMIEIGQLLKSVDDFNGRIRLNRVPDAKKKDRVYIQARSYAIINKKKTFIGAYVGKENQYTSSALAKTIQTLKDRYHNHVNQQLAAYNCKIEDFK
jgi:hypothetical protein